MRFIKTLFLIFISVNVFGQSVIPKPKKSKLSAKGSLDISTIKYISCHGGQEMKRLAKWINNNLFQDKLEIKYNGNIYARNTIDLVEMYDMPPNNEESYSLNIMSNSTVMISGSPKGVFYGVMTLLQLAQKSNGNISNLSIEDSPEFKWRGMHLDVSRHFFDVDFIKKYIDLLALHKMNTFHWHLTDDQGWRIEIKKYPKLTQIGSQRKETIVGKNFNPYKGDGKPYGGFYTQEEIKEVVAYAKERYITIVPEIEMPGHAVAALSAYPQFSCREQPLETLTKWGISDDIYCSKDETFQFLFNVMDEVLNLFPSKYIHIGGDEAPKTRWKQCKHCQANIKKHHLKDEHELQSYFIGRMDSFLTSRGRKTIGWDEILEGGLADNAAVMSWRGEKGGIEAAKQKHNVVMSPGSHCYFDHYQGDKKSEPLAIGGYTTLKKVYDYNPIPNGLDQEYEKYILGAQGNVWTEYMKTPEQVMYMALPRLCALSEVLWSGPGKSSYNEFTKRLIPHFKLLDSLQYNYSKALFNIESQTTVKNGKMFVSLQSDFPDYDIRYTSDGSAPMVSSSLYNESIQINNDVVIKARLFKNGKASGNTFSQEYKYHLAIGKKIKLLYPPDERYNTGGASTLINGIVGSLPWSGNEWLGWRGESMEVTLDLGLVEEIHRVKISFLEAKESWIHLPKKVVVLVGRDEKKYREIELSNLEGGFTFSGDLNLYERYLKIKAIPQIIIPNGNPGAGQKPWLFCSEIIIE